MDGDDDSNTAAPTSSGGLVAVDCRRLAHLLCDYVDDALPAETRQAMDGHMAQCAPCLTFLRQYKFAPDALRRKLLGCVPADLESRLLTFLRGKCGR